MTGPGPRFLLKDLFNRQSLGALANQVDAVIPASTVSGLQPESPGPPVDRGAGIG